MGAACKGRSHCVGLFVSWILASLVKETAAVFVHVCTFNAWRAFVLLRLICDMYRLNEMVADVLCKCSASHSSANLVTNLIRHGNSFAISYNLL